jgi:hypothetical protein
MKKNLLLSLILSLLITFAYFSEEVLKGERKELQKSTSRLINTSFPITEIKTKQYHFVKSNGIWKEPTVAWGIDQEVLNEVVNIFQQIGKFSTIKKTGNGEYFSENTTQFDLLVNGNWKRYVLGNVSKITGSFYVKDLDQEETVNICTDDSLLQVIHKTPVDLNLKKYLRLKNIINSKVNKFFDHNIFTGLNINLDKLKTVTIDNKTNRWFNLDIQEKVTNPTAPINIRYRNFFNRMIESIEKIKIIKIIGQGQNVLTNPRGTIKFDGEKESSLKLYSGLNGKYGQYLKVKGRNDIIEMKLEDSSLFFLNIQDFWIKKIKYEVDFKSLKNFDFQMSTNGNRYYQFRVNDLETFKVTTLDKKVSFISNTHINFLFNLLLNLADFKEAHHIEVIHPSEKANKGEKIDLHIKLFKKHFSVGIEEDFITVRDYNSMVLYKFKYNQTQVDPSFFDKIFTVVKK